MGNGYYIVDDMHGTIEEYTTHMRAIDAAYKLARRVAELNDGPEWWKEYDFEEWDDEENGMSGVCPAGLVSFERTAAIKGWPTVTYKCLPY